MTNIVRVGLLYGGKSVEHEISIRSARNVYEQLDRVRFEPVLIGITKTGDWYMTENLDQPIEKGQPLTLSLSNSTHTFHVLNSSDGTGTLDVVFPVLHGTDGEDGSIQGMLQTVDLPCAGSGVLGSSVAMDKLMSKQLLVKAGIPTSKFQAVFDATSVSFEQLATEIGLPFMIKPISLGSSVGVSKVSTEQQFKQALEDALSYDSGFLVEQYISGRELECGILGNQQARATSPGEIIISPKYEFYTYDAKYEDPDAVEIKIPAMLDPAVEKKIMELSLSAYKALRCEDYARVDLFLDEHNKVFINEINTIPGFTNSSMFPSLWGQHGISYQDLITRIIDLALERFAHRISLNRDYSAE